MLKRGDVYMETICDTLSDGQPHEVGIGRWNSGMISPYSKLGSYHPFHKGWYPPNQPIMTPLDLVCFLGRMVISLQALLLVWVVSQFNYERVKPDILLHLFRLSSLVHL